MSGSLKRQYDRDGYLLGIPVLTPDEVRHYNALYDQLKERVSKRSSKGRLTI